MSSRESDRELGNKLLQVFDEIKSQPLRKSRGHEVCERVTHVLLSSDNGAEIVSFNIDAKRYTFKCFDFFISGLAGGLRSVRLGLFDDHQRQLFGATVPEGEIEVLNLGDWIEDFTRLHQSIAAIVRERRIRDPYGLENLVAEGLGESKGEGDKVQTSDPYRGGRSKATAEERRREPPFPLRLLLRLLRRLSGRTAPRGPRYDVPDDNVVLVLVADTRAQRVLLEVLNVKYSVTIAYTAREAGVLMRAFRYRLVIVTNYGMPPVHAVSVVPKDHAYPVIFLSGHYNQEVRRICQEKRLRCMDLPFEIETLRRTVAEEIGEPPE